MGGTRRQLDKPPGQKFRSWVRRHVRARAVQGTITVAAYQTDVRGFVGYLKSVISPWLVSSGSLVD